MPDNKLVVTDTQLTSIANAIRTKTGKTAPISFPTEFVSEIESISGGGDAAYRIVQTIDTERNTSSIAISDSTEVLLQNKTITENGTVLPDTGYDGFSSVVVNVPNGNLPVTEYSEVSALASVSLTRGDRVGIHNPSDTGLYIQGASTGALFYGTYMSQIFHVASSKIKHIVAIPRVQVYNLIDIWDYNTMPFTKIDTIILPENLVVTSSTNRLSMSPDGNLLALIGDSSNQLYVYDISQTPAVQINHGLTFTYAWNVILNSKYHQLVVTDKISDSSYVSKVYDITNSPYQQLGINMVHSIEYGGQLSPDSEKFVFVNGNTLYAYKFNSSSQCTMIGSKSSMRGWNCAGWSSDSTKVVVHDTSYLYVLGITESAITTLFSGVWASYTPSTISWLNNELITLSCRGSSYYGLRTHRYVSGSSELPYVTIPGAPTEACDYIYWVDSTHGFLALGSGNGQVISIYYNEDDYTCEKFSAISSSFDSYGVAMENINQNTTGSIAIIF